LLEEEARIPRLRHGRARHGHPLDGRVLSFDRPARLCGGELAIRRCVAAVAFAPIPALRETLIEAHDASLDGHCKANGLTSLICERFQREKLTSPLQIGGKQPL
jgi:hypothetical protein